MPHMDIPLSTFHLGFILSTAIMCFSIHLMMLITEPDFSEAETRDSWRRHARFLQLFMFLPLVGFLLTHMDQDPNTAIWFVATTVVSAALFLPLELKYRDAHEATPLPKTLADGTPMPDVKELRPHRNDPFASLVKAASAEKPVTAAEAEEHFREVSRTHFRILIGNFALGLLMGASILLPFAFMVAAVGAAHKLGLIDVAVSENILKMVPGLCSLMVPLVMPLSFLVLGPTILRFTQGARLLSGAEGWKDRWQRLCDRAKALGYKGTDRMEILELPWKHAGFRNAFYIGLPSALNPFLTGIFLVKGIEDVLGGAEIDFVISHEAAHGLSKHAVNRMKLGLGIFLFFVITQVMAFMMRAPSLSLVFAAGCFIWGYMMLKKQGELHELEADVLAINIMGGDEEAVSAAVDALKKLDHFNVKATTPFTEKRIAYIRAIFSGAGRKPGDDFRKAA